MDIGQTMSELPTYHTGGAPSILERNSEWVEMMDKAPTNEWVVLEKLTNNVVSNNTRIRNRVWSLNRKQNDFEFTSRTLDNEIVMFGRRR
jgi:hypothetical protein